MLRVKAFLYRRRVSRGLDTGGGLSLRSHLCRGHGDSEALVVEIERKRGDLGKFNLTFKEVEGDGLIKVDEKEGMAKRRACHSEAVTHAGQWICS